MYVTVTRGRGAENAGVENAGVKASQVAFNGKWKMREHITGLENTGVDRRGGKCRGGNCRSDKVWKANSTSPPSVHRDYSYATIHREPKMLSKASIPAFVGGSKFRIIVCLHPSLFAFLGHLQHITIDSVSNVSKVTRGLAIRRAKKRVNLTNDKRIKICLQRFDSHACTRLQFLRAVSHAVGSQKMLSESHADADDDDDTEAPDDNRQHQNDDTSDDAGTPTTVSADAAVDFCEVSRGTA